MSFIGWALLLRSGLHPGLGGPDLGTLMRHAFSFTLASAKPTLALSVERSTPKGPLVPTRRFPLPLSPSRLAALRPAVNVPAIAGPADHHQPVAASAAELPSIMLLGDLVRVFDGPPGAHRTET